MREIDELREDESRLQQAQLASDLVELDRLLHPDLVFVGPDGDISGKADDLHAHGSGSLSLEVLEPVDLLVRVIEGVGVTVLTARLAGTAAGYPFDAVMRYSRSWTRSPSGWRVVLAHESITMPHEETGPDVQASA